MTLSKPVQNQTQVTSGETPLERLSSYLSEDLASVNAIIIDRMHSNVALIPKLATHLIAAGGKRIRPLMTLAAASLLGYQGIRQHKLAACVEFIHTATLLHDDVVDESGQRRGIASANAIFGNEAAVLVGDFLFSRAFTLMVEDGSLDVLRILSKASSVIAEGEVLQLSTTRNVETTEKDYIDVVTAKTAELFAAACEVGAIVSEAPAAQIEAFRVYGMNLGIAFQIVDDILDYAATETKMGKSLGDDFREGKITAPVVHALQRATDEELKFWTRTLGDLQQDENDFIHAKEILEAHGSINAAITMARDYGRQAEQALLTFPQNEVRDMLQNIVTFTIDRDF